MSEKLEVDCECHGKSSAAVVCGHLVSNIGSPIGFIENSSLPEDLQGWCFACEHFYSIEEDMTDKFRKFNDMSVVCSQCYQDIKSRHTIAI